MYLYGYQLAETVYQAIDFPPVGRVVAALIDEDLPPNPEKDAYPWVELLKLNYDEKLDNYFWTLAYPDDSQDEHLHQYYTVIAWRDYKETVKEIDLPDHNHPIQKSCYGCGSAGSCNECCYTCNKEKK